VTLKTGITAAKKSAFHHRTKLHLKKIFIKYSFIMEYISV